LHATVLRIAWHGNLALVARRNDATRRAHSRVDWLKTRLRNGNGPSRTSMRSAGAARATASPLGQFRLITKARCYLKYAGLRTAAFLPRLGCSALKGTLHKTKAPLYGWLAAGPRRNGAQGERGRRPAMILKHAERVYLAPPSRSANDLSGVSSSATGNAPGVDAPRSRQPSSDST
jgi:hypothetical protein